MRKLLVSLLLLSSTANAWNITPKWDRPVYREDCSALARTEIGKYELEWVHLGNLKRGTKFPKADLTAYTLTVADTGLYGLRIRTYDTTNLVSKWSDQLKVEIMADGKIVPTPYIPTPSKCGPTIPPPPPVCPYVCTPI